MCRAGRETSLTHSLTVVVVVLVVVAGPMVWNSLQSDELRDPACDVDSFKQFFKTILFSFY